ncbi:hypothetical protein ASE98_20000 [Pseudomonas sp. Leaf48]|uniref:hypothetical protein n=1 Tax=Pseudomonas sp. Leaf48 TaxID=1736221 RepID=UPI00072487EB|nr:hypothetical protein [Pseudomonas sp. Leaf48]KQN53368.1 hypothetical protein ASE98_20000 [Pseudomonas sp. Leaf48]
MMRAPGAATDQAADADADADADSDSDSDSAKAAEYCAYATVMIVLHLCQCYLLDLRAGSQGERSGDERGHELRPRQSRK